MGVGESSVDYGRHGGAIVAIHVVLFFMKIMGLSRTGAAVVCFALVLFQCSRAVGKTPLQWASEVGRKDIAKLLKAHGAR